MSDDLAAARVKLIRQFTSVPFNEDWIAVAEFETAVRAEIARDVEKTCGQVHDVREYGERGTPFYNGASQLARRIRAVMSKEAET